MRGIGASHHGGTRFRLFPQAPFLHPERPPEIVHISVPPGLVGPGPGDDRLFVIDPVGKHHGYGLIAGPYGTPHLNLPPWRGPVRWPAQPDAYGHFDHIPVVSPTFSLAHAFGTLCFVLDVWERFFGRRIQWHFARHYPRLEVSMRPSLDNARVGYGFMEIGTHPNDDGTLVHYALNFDVLAHELGHLIIYGTLGLPDPAAVAGEYFGFQEAAADMTALVTALHFDSMVDQLLEDTRGNLYALNELNRFAELSTSTQIRLASNTVRLSDFAAGWDDEHDLSQPLTGALFDILVDIYQEILVERGVIRREIADLSDAISKHPEYDPVIQSVFDTVYRRNDRAIRSALLEARDYLGFVLAETWKRLSLDFIRYEDIARTLLGVDRDLSGGRYWPEMIESFTWREIGTVTVGPRITPPAEGSHASPARTIVPELGRGLPRMSYRERVLLARGA
jgi:hypothetical protein